MFRTQQRSPAQLLYSKNRSTPSPVIQIILLVNYYGCTLSVASMLYFADVFFIFFFIPALVGQTAERIFTKLSHVVDIRCYLRTY